ncbi:MAG: ATP-dependent helicase, partial [Candidatus Omnitrophota bacterium]
MKRPHNVNDAQWQAVTHAGEHLLISAGPGTGKTHTLTHRICYLLSKCQDHEHILAITFTNKASQEMRQRLDLLCPDSLTRIEASTFHAFCLTCLRAFASLAHLPKDFQVASALDIEAVTKEMWSDVQRKERQKRLQEISRYKNFVTQTPSEYLASYNHQLRKRNLLDFDDILWEALCLFHDNKEVLQEVQSRYRAIFVDEYQDINHVQHEILKLLVQGDVGLTPLENAADKAVGKTPFRFGNDVLPSSKRETRNNSLTGLTAIGDPHQAIYGFRGSDVRFFHDFLTDFPLSQHLSLSENYRSSGNLLAAAHQVIVQGPTLNVPALVARMHTQGRLVIYKASTERAEAEYVVHEIEKLVGGTSMFSKDSKRVSPEAEGQVSFGDIAILYRMNAQRKPLEEALERSGIPYDVSGDLPLCEEKEVLALLPDLLKMRHTPINEVVDYRSALGKNPSHCLERLLDLAKRSK